MLETQYCVVHVQFIIYIYIYILNNVEFTIMPGNWLNGGQDALLCTSILSLV